MSDAPLAEDLLLLSTAHLRTRVAANLDADTRYNVLLAARAAEIAWRDRSLAAALTEAQRAVERAAGGEEAAARIRAGDCDRDEALHATLLAMTAIAAYPTRPDVPSESERAAIERMRR